jgi:hypothetical protein
MRLFLSNLVNQDEDSLEDQKRHSPTSVFSISFSPHQTMVEDNQPDRHRSMFQTLIQKDASSCMTNFPLRSPKEKGRRLTTSPYLRSLG